MLPLTLCFVLSFQENIRRSRRLSRSTQINFDEDAMFRERGLGEIVAPKPAKRAGWRSSSHPESPYDSGLGVRRQGGRIYDSKNGVTCHWCRQKTLEDHVVCTSPECGGGKTLPVSFCRMCLWNRHGENVYDALLSGCWICPKCRGNCGEGCVSCCNCGPCRKKHGLAPTHQIVKEARMSGFGNAHDYLVHQRTGENADQISERKAAFAWGQWLFASESEDTPVLEKPIRVTTRRGASSLKQSLKHQGDMRVTRRGLLQ